METFIKSKIHHMHERALRIVNTNKDLSLNKLWKKDGCFALQQRKILTLSVELLKVNNGLSSE